MEPAAATQYRALAARFNYLAMDRAKMMARHMSSPKKCDWRALKQVARALLYAPRVVQEGLAMLRTW